MPLTSVMLQRDRLLDSFAVFVGIFIGFAVYTIEAIREIAHYAVLDAIIQLDAAFSLCLISVLYFKFFSPTKTIERISTITPVAAMTLLILSAWSNESTYTLGVLCLAFVIFLIIYFYNGSLINRYSSMHTFESSLLSHRLSAMLPALFVLISCLFLGFTQIYATVNIANPVNILEYKYHSFQYAFLSAPIFLMSIADISLACAVLFGVFAALAFTFSLVGLKSDGLATRVTVLVMLVAAFVALTFFASDSVQRSAAALSNTPERLRLIDCNDTDSLYPIDKSKCVAYASSVLAINVNSFIVIILTFLLIYIFPFSRLFSLPFISTQNNFHFSKTTRCTFFPALLVIIFIVFLSVSIYNDYLRAATFGAAFFVILFSTTILSFVVILLKMRPRKLSILIFLLIFVTLIHDLIAGRQYVSPDNLKRDAGNSTSNHCLDGEASAGQTVEREIATKGCNFDFFTWVGTRRDAEEYDNYPVYFVITEGGGARAAYFTYSILGALQDLCPKFYDHIIAISGTSGGSVGGALFEAHVQSKKERLQSGVCNLNGIDLNKLDRQSALSSGRRTFSNDWMSDSVHALLFQQLVPAWRYILGNRQAGAFALEEAILRSTDPDTRKALTKSIIARSNNWASENGRTSPLLLFNTVDANTGGTRPISNFQYDPGLSDSLDRGNQQKTGIHFAFGERSANETVDVTKLSLLSSSIYSARFPLITEVGTLFDRDFNKRLDLVDGGYYDNSGAETARRLGLRYAAKREETLKQLQRVLDCRKDDPKIAEEIGTILDSCHPDSDNYRTNAYEVLVKSLLNIENAKITASCIQFVESDTFLNCKKIIRNYGERLRIPNSEPAENAEDPKLNKLLFDNPGKSGVRALRTFSNSKFMFLIIRSTPLPWVGEAWGANWRETGDPSVMQSFLPVKALLNGRIWRAQSAVSSLGDLSYLDVKTNGGAGTTGLSFVFRDLEVETVPLTWTLARRSRRVIDFFVNSSVGAETWRSDYAPSAITDTTKSTEFMPDSTIQEVQSELIRGYNDNGNSKSLWANVGDFRSVLCDLAQGWPVKSNDETNLAMGPCGGQVP